jgi:peptidoglycan/LPS O-acetylase OafA/YrhL
MKKLYLIELLRFISSISVLIYHYKIFFFQFNGYIELNVNNQLNQLPLNSIINLFYRYGDYGVQMFWCISGFIISYVYLNRKKVTGMEFFLNRFSRLYPLHFITLILVLFIQLASKNLTGDYQLFDFNDLYHFILNLFFVSGWGFQNGLNFNQPIWSVSMELIAYCFFFMTLRYIKNFHFKFLIFLYIILMLIDKNFSTPNMNDNILSCLNFFISGVIVYFLMKKTKKKLFVIFSIVLLLLTFIGNFKIFMFCPAVLMIFISLEDKFIKFINKPLFSILGNVTYSTYLLHAPYSIVLILFFKNNMEVYLSPIFFSFYFISLIIVSSIVYIYIEKKSQIRIRQIYGNVYKKKIEN